MSHTERALNKTSKHIDHLKLLLAGSMSSTQRAQAEAWLKAERERFIHLYFAVKDEQEVHEHEMVAA